VVIKIKFSILNDTLFISTEKKFKLGHEITYSKYDKLTNSQFSDKKLKQSRNSDTYHEHLIKK